jgi:hypothetical protein
VGRGSDGFPTLEGKVTEIRGKHLTIRCTAMYCRLRWSRLEEVSQACNVHTRSCVPLIKIAERCLCPRCAPYASVILGVSCACSCACPNSLLDPSCRKLDDNKVDEELRAVIRSFCEGLVAALNKCVTVWRMTKCSFVLQQQARSVDLLAVLRVLGRCADRLRVACAGTMHSAAASLMTPPR